MVSERILYPPGFSTEKDPSVLTDEEIRRFSFLIHEASLARAYPDQSGFFVKTAGITEGGKLWTGGNKEFADSDTIAHGETAVVSGIRDMTNERIEAIAWYRDKETGPLDFGRPCGNCRDALLKFCDPELVLLNGNERTFVYTRLKDFLFEDFKEAEIPSRANGLYVDAGYIAREAGIDIYLPEEMKPRTYGAVLVAENGDFWRGSLYSNDGYDSITPVLGAVLNYQYNYPVGRIDRDKLSLRKLVVVGVGLMPHIYYRDRQALLGLDEALRRFTGKADPMEVEIINVAGDYWESGRVNKIYKTDSEEWLPHPFTAGAFRRDDIVLAKLGKLIGPENLKKV